MIYTTKKACLSKEAKVVDPVLGISANMRWRGFKGSGLSVVFEAGSGICCLKSGTVHLSYKVHSFLQTKDSYHQKAHSKVDLTSRMLWTFWMVQKKGFLVREQLSKSPGKLMWNVIGQRCGVLLRCNLGHVRYPVDVDAGENHIEPGNVTESYIICRLLALKKHTRWILRLPGKYWCWCPENIDFFC